jgi:hypothetical protein
METHRLPNDCSSSLRGGGREYRSIDLVSSGGLTHIGAETRLVMGFVFIHNLKGSAIRRVRIRRVPRMPSFLAPISRAGKGLRPLPKPGSGRCFGTSQSQKDQSSSARVRNEEGAGRC